MRISNHLTRLIASAAAGTMLLCSLPAEAADDDPKDKQKAAEVVNAIGGLLGGLKKPKPAADTANQANAQNAASSADQDSVKQAQQNDVATGVVAGAAIGAAAGAAVNEKDRGKGAAVGAVAGGTVGGLVGASMAKARGNYAARYQELDQAIASAEEKVQTLSASTRVLEQRIRTREAQLAAARARNASTKTAIASTQQTLNEIDADITANNQASETAMVTLKVLNENIESLNTPSSGSAAPPATADPEMASRKAQLETKRNEMVQILKRINDADAMVLAQRDALRKK